MRAVGRLLLGAFLAVAGVGHFVATDAFLAQVPPWMPAPEWVVWISGVVELVAAALVLFAPARLRPAVGIAVAALFIAVFPGNVAQYAEGRSAFGLDTDGARLTRLFFQPLLVLWAVWALGAWPRPRRDEAVA